MLTKLPGLYRIESAEWLLSYPRFSYFRDSSLTGSDFYIFTCGIDIYRKKTCYMKNIKLYEDFDVNEADTITKIKPEDEKRFKADFTVDNKYMFDTKLSAEDRKAILMAKIDALGKKKRLNPGQVEKMKLEYAKEFGKMGDLDQIEDTFRSRWSAVKYKPKSKGVEKAKGLVKSLLAPDPGSVASFKVLDDLMNDLFD